MAYLNLLYRQRSYAFLDQPAEWQKSVDKALEWRDKTALAVGKSARHRRLNQQMAFEAFLNQRRAAPTRRRRVMVTLSLIFHGALLVVAFVHSFWRIEELSPPTVTVTFLSATTPPAPPPPPPKRKSAPKSKPYAAEADHPAPAQRDPAAA